MHDPRPKLRWYQFRLRTLLIFVTLFAIPCSWVAVKKEQKRREREAATEIEKLGGKVAWSRPWGPRSSQRLLGDDLFGSVTIVVLDGTQVTDAGLEHLKGLGQLRQLEFRSTQVTDAGLEHLQGLKQLQWLALDETKVTDAGLEHLQGLGQLRELQLNGTQVTDAGLEHLKGLGQLQTLRLTGTHVTDAGVGKLQQTLPKCNILHWASYRPRNN
jgi:Leucine-rich repeat (LRR) protein